MYNSFLYIIYIYNKPVPIVSWSVKVDDATIYCIKMLSTLSYKWLRLTSNESAAL